MKFVDIQGCPVPAKAAPFIRYLIAQTGAQLQSAYRGSAPEAQPILKRHGKHTQAYLYRHQHEPGFYPANPPGRSTHELRNDGVAYPHMRVGAKLAWWQLGYDFRDTDIERLILAARKKGWKLSHFYSSSSEYHHLNFAKPPLWHRVKAALRR